jgi:hypothetical protein
LSVFLKLLTTSIIGIGWFCIVILIMLTAFTSAFYHKHNHQAELANMIEGENSFSFFRILAMEYQLMYGEFETENFDSKTDWAVFLICSFFMTLIMMNVLIAIISDRY